MKVNHVNNNLLVFSIHPLIDRAPNIFQCYLDFSSDVIRVLTLTLLRSVPFLFNLSLALIPARSRRQV